MDNETATTVMAWSAAVQAVGTVGAIWASVYLSRRQATREAATRAQDRSDAVATQISERDDAKLERAKTEAAATALRDARARVLAFRLMAILSDIDASLKRVMENGENFAKIDRLFQLGGEDLANRMLKVDADWTDNIFGDFDTLPPELAAAVAYLLYSAGQYNRSLATQIHLYFGGDTQPLAAYFRSRHDVMEGFLRKALSLLTPLLDTPQ